MYLARLNVFVREGCQVVWEPMQGMTSGMGHLDSKDNKISLQIACILYALPYIRLLMLRKLLILVLALSLGTAATASEWLVPAHVVVAQAAHDQEATDAPAPQHFFESLQIIPAQLGGIHWEQTLPEAQHPVGYRLPVQQPFLACDVLPDAVIQRQRVLFTHIMPALAP